MLCGFEQYLKSWMKRHLGLKLICYITCHLNLLIQDIQCKLNCLFCLAQCIPYLFAHTVKSGTRSYMFGNKYVSQEFGCQSRMGFHCRKKGMNP